MNEISGSANRIPEVRDSGMDTEPEGIRIPDQFQNDFEVSIENSGSM